MAATKDVSMEPTVRSLNDDLVCDNFDGQFIVQVNYQAKIQYHCKLNIL